MAKQINGILFDLGDTLLDFGNVHIPSLFKNGAKLAYGYLKQLGHPLPAFAKYHRRQLWAIRWNYFKSRFTRREFNALDILGQLSARMGHELTHEQMLELAWLWYEPLSRCARMEEGLREMLAGFQAEGLKLGMISNTFVPGEVIDRHLRRENLLELLPVRVYSCAFHYLNPNPAIIHIAPQQGAPAASETIFVGDSPHADIKGANEAGMISVLKDPTGKYDSNSVRANHRIRAITELSRIVSQYNVEA